MKCQPALAAARRAFAIVLAVSDLSSPTRAEVTTPVLDINKEAANPTITVQKLRGNLSVVMGSGGNIVVLNTPNGKLLGDAGIAVSKPQIEAALASIGPAPIKYLINTHYHWDPHRRQRVGARRRCNDSGPREYFEAIDFRDPRNRVGLFLSRNPESRPADHSC